MPIVNVYKEKELKNAYIGKCYEFNYNFRGSSSTIVTNDGWTISWIVGFDVNWLYKNTSGNVALLKSLSSTEKSFLSSASKLTISMDSIIYGASTFSIHLTDSSATYLTWFELDQNRNTYRVALWWTDYNYSGLSAGTYSTTLVADLVNKTYTLSSTGTSDKTGTISDAEISYIKSRDVIRIYIKSVTSNNTRIKDISITIE